MLNQKFLYCSFNLLPLLLLLCTSEESLAPSSLQFCCRELKKIAKRNIIIHTKPELSFKSKYFNNYNYLSSFWETALKMQNIIKINFSTKGFIFCVPEVGLFACAHIASASSCALPA